MQTLHNEIFQKMGMAMHYSSKFNNNCTFFVLSNGENVVLNNSMVATEELCGKGYKVISSFTNGKETKYVFNW